MHSMTRWNTPWHAVRGKDNHRNFTKYYSSNIFKIESGLLPIFSNNTGQRKKYFRYSNAFMQRTVKFEWSGMGQS